MAEGKGACFHRLVGSLVCGNTLGVALLGQVINFFDPLEEQWVGTSSGHDAMRDSRMIGRLYIEQRARSRHARGYDHVIQRRIYES